MLDVNSNPLDSSQFQQNFQQLLQQNNLAQGSIALIQGSDPKATVNTYQATNSSFTDTNINGRNVPLASLPDDSIFRIASISKTFTAAAILELAQDHPDLLQLNDKAFQLLGYTPGQEVTGLNPLNPDNDVSVKINPEVFNITVAELLQMTGGFPGESSPSSQVFPLASASLAGYLTGLLAAALILDALIRYPQDGS